MRTSLYPWLAALKTAVLLSLAWPPLNLSPMIFLGLIPMIWVFLKADLGKKPGRKFFFIAFLSMLVWNALTTWWVGLASGVGAGLAIGLNSLFMAMIWRIAFGVKRELGQRMGCFALVFLWLSFEYIHYRWELIWPWLNLGNAFADHPNWVQWYSFTGVLGGSLWIWAFNFFLFFFFTNRGQVERFKTGALVLLIALVPFFWSRHLEKRVDVEEGTPMEVVVVQPNIDAYTEKYDMPIPQQVNKFLSLALQEVDEDTDWILFPETAIPQGLWTRDLEASWILDGFRSLKKQAPNAEIITGASVYHRYEQAEKRPTPSARFHKSGGFWYDAYNSALWVQPDEVELYHKSKLVPGVEQMPYDDLLTPLKSLAFDLGGTTGTLGKQDSAEVFGTAETGKVGAIICYESVCGDYVGDFVEKGAGMIGVITNDDWWGNTAGYKQHFAYARLRAVETRRWVARSANTGISGFINPRGEVIQASEFKVDAALKETVYFRQDISFYVRYGDYLGRVAVFFALLLVLYSWVKSRLPQYAK